MVEHSTPNPKAGGSNPVPGTGGRENGKKSLLTSEKIFMKFALNVVYQHKYVLNISVNNFYFFLNNLAYLKAESKDID